jgi:hypothetical protein
MRTNWTEKVTTKKIARKTKQQHGVKPTETKILGVKLEKENDTLNVQLGSNSESPTKRSILSRLANIYDPIGIAVCNHTLPWDVELKGAIKKRWEKWEDNLPSEVTVPRPIAPFQWLLFTPTSIVNCMHIRNKLWKLRL